MDCPVDKKSLGQVKGAGEWYVNGVYLRTPQRVRELIDVKLELGTEKIQRR